MENATDKQIKFMKQLGIDKPEQYSKGTARELIAAKVAETDDLKNGKVDAEVVTPGAPVRKENGTQKQIVRMNSITNAIALAKESQENYDRKAILLIADEFVRYVENGN